MKLAVALCLLCLAPCGAWAQGSGSGGSGGAGGGQAKPENSLPQARLGSSSTGAQTPNDEQRFVAGQAQSALAQQQLGALAVRQAGSPDIVTFGRWMQADATDMDKALRNVANGAALPTTLDGPHQAVLNRLRRLHGNSFDTAYLSAVLDDQNAAIDALKQQGKAGQDPALTFFARQQLPTLEAHQQEANDLRSRLPGGDQAPPDVGIENDVEQRLQNQELTRLKQAPQHAPKPPPH